VTTTRFRNHLRSSVLRKKRKQCTLVVYSAWRWFSLNKNSFRPLVTIECFFTIIKYDYRFYKTESYWTILKIQGLVANLSRTTRNTESLVYELVSTASCETLTLRLGIIVLINLPQILTKIYNYLSLRG